MFAHLASLLALDLSDNTISSIPGNVLDGTPALQKQNNSLPEVALQPLNNLHDPFLLNLSLNHLTNAFSKLGSLSTLSLKLNYLQVILKNLFQVFPKLMTPHQKFLTSENENADYDATSANQVMHTEAVNNKNIVRWRYKLLLLLPKLLLLSVQIFHIAFYSSDMKFAHGLLFLFNPPISQPYPNSVALNIKTRVVKESSLHQQFLQLQNQLLQIHWSLFWDCWENVTNLTVTIVQTYKYYSGGVFIPIFGLIGIIGNIFTLTVRSRPKFKDCFHKLLFSSACYKAIFIISGGINYT